MNGRAPRGYCQNNFIGENMKKHGDPAFPTPMVCDAGMALRDWFAGMALQGLLSSMTSTGIIQPKEAAPTAYQYADVMISEREK
jgi:hypothetical protein